MYTCLVLASLITTSFSFINFDLFSPKWEGILAQKDVTAPDGTFSDDIRSCSFFTRSKNCGVENPTKPAANTHSIIALLNPNNYRYDNGEFRFILAYTNTDGSKDKLVWTQTSWSTARTVTGFKKYQDDKYTFPDQSSVTGTPKEFQGLRFASQNLAFLDGNSAFWGWNVVGAIKYEGEGFSGFNGKLATKAALCVCPKNAECKPSWPLCKWDGPPTPPPTPQPTSVDVYGQDGREWKWDGKSWFYNPRHSSNRRNRYAPFCHDIDADNDFCQDSCNGGGWFIEAKAKGGCPAGFKEVRSEFCGDPPYNNELCYRESVNRAQGVTSSLLLNDPSDTLDVYGDNTTAFSIKKIVELIVIFSSMVFIFCTLPILICHYCWNRKLNPKQQGFHGIPVWYKHDVEEQ